MLIDGFHNGTLMKYKKIKLLRFSFSELCVPNTIREKRDLLSHWEEVREIYSHQGLVILSRQFHQNLSLTKPGSSHLKSIFHTWHLLLIFFYFKSVHCCQSVSVLTSPVAKDFLMSSLLTTSAHFSLS